MNRSIKDSHGRMLHYDSHYPDSFTSGPQPTVLQDRHLTSGHASLNYRH
jgi:hypothetical protein